MRDAIRNPVLAGVVAISGMMGLGTTSAQAQGYGAYPGVGGYGQGYPGVGYGGGSYGGGYVGSGGISLGVGVGGYPAYQLGGYGNGYGLYSGGYTGGYGGYSHHHHHRHHRGCGHHGY